tara:strand:- start:385 stop:540 length:156 start_codon:yes stop_codon:yes gene_type:complete
MTKDERQELRQIQETLIVALAKITEMLGTPKPAPAVRYKDDSEAKERFIAP